MISRLKSFLPQDVFARSVSLLAGGTAAGQLIVVASSPILTRLYSPEDFGLLAVFSALLMILSVFASLRYQFAIALPERNDEALQVLVLSLLTVLIIAIVIGLGVYFVGNGIARALNSPALAPLLWILPIGVLAHGIYEVFNYWALRVKAFGVIGRTRLAQSAGMVAVQAAGFAFGPAALLLGYVVGQAAGTFKLASLVFRKHRSGLWGVELSDVASAAKRYREFPMYSMPGGVLNTASKQLAPLLFAGFFSPAAAGLYLLAHRVLAMPVYLIGNAVGDALLSHGVNARRNGTLGPAVLALHERLTRFGMAPAILVSVFSPWLFADLFGEEWRVAGDFARYLAPALYMQFVSMPLAPLFTVLEKPHLTLLCNVQLVVLRTATILIAATFGDLLFAVMLFSAASFVAYLIFSTATAYSAGIPVRRLLHNHLMALVSSVAVLALPIAVLWTWPLSYLPALCLAIAITLIYYAWLWRRIPSPNFGR